MKTWTKQAEGRLEEYIEARARRDNLVGSDIRELREDLSAHVYEEAEGLEVERIGSVDVEKIIAGLESGSADQVALVTRKKGWSWALVFGVIMPLLVAIIEILSGFCGGVFFDPVPTVWHSLLVLSVPLVNWWLLTKGRAAGAMAQGIAAGISVVVAIFYGLLFLPLLPLSILAILAMGLGFLSLTPVFAAIAVWLGLRFIWRKAEKPPGISLQLFAITLGLWIAGTVFYSGEEWMGHIGALLILFGTIFGWVLFDRLVSYGWLAKKERAGMPIILRQLCGAIVVLIAASSILKWGYGLELTGLIATSGVAAVILGFAMQDLLSNVIAGFSIHVTGAYQVGDWLLIGEGDKRAEVIEINWRSTRLTDNDRISYELPNSEVVKNRIVNLNHPRAEHGVRLRFGLDYDTPPALAKEVILKAARSAQGVLEAPGPMVFTREFGDSSITYELRIWMRHARLYNVTCDEIRTALWYELGRRNMRIPFPIRTLDKRKHNIPDAIVSSRDRAAEILRGGTALECLTEAESDRLVENGKLLVYGPREPLMTRGDVGESMFVVLEGSVEVIGKTEKGPRVVLASLGVGECFGEMSLVTGEPRNATVRAKGDVLVLEIRKGDLSPLMDENPELAERLGELLEKRRKNRSERLHRADEEQASGKPGEQSTRSLSNRIRDFFA